MIKRYLLLVLLCLLVFSGMANQKDSVANHIFMLIYQNDLQAAENQLNLNENKLDDFYFLLLNLDLHWWKYRLNNTRQEAQSLDKLLNKLNSGEATTAWNKIQQVLAKTYKLRYQKTRFNFIGMLSTRADIKKLIAELNMNDLPLKEKQLLLFESYVIMFHYIENINFIGIQNKSAERKILLDRMSELAVNKDLMLSTIARYFIARMYQKVEDDPTTGLQHFKLLTHQFPANKTFAEYQKECEDEL